MQDDTALYGAKMMQPGLTAADSATSRASKSASAVSTVRRASSGVPSDGGTVL